MKINIIKTTRENIGCSPKKVSANLLHQFSTVASRL